MADMTVIPPAERDRSGAACGEEQAKGSRVAIRHQSNLKTGCLQALSQRLTIVALDAIDAPLRWHVETSRRVRGELLVIFAVDAVDQVQPAGGEEDGIFRTFAIDLQQ